MPLKERSTGSAPSATDEEPRHNAPGAIIAELDILKPLPTVVNDDSPQFTLLDVEVLAKDGSKIVSLLHAELGGPFRVRGTLLLDRKQKAKYLLPNAKLPKSHIFELDDVSTFAVESNPTNIWAAGKAGWYEIQPAPEYEATYNDMKEGIDIFYTLEDMHTDEADSTRRCPLHVDLLALEWIRKRGVKLPIETVKTLWLGHAKFLIGQMQKPSDVDWPSTPIYAWLAESVPSIYKLYHPQGYVKTYPSPSSKSKMIVNLIHDVMDANPARHWTIESLSKAMTCEKLGLKSADAAKEHIEANASAIIQQLDNRYLGSSVAYHLLEKATARELELGSDATAEDDIGPGVHKRAEVENLRRNRATAKTVVDLMHNLAASGEISIQSLSVESVASELYKRYIVTSEQAAVELIKSASSAITAAIAQWGLKYIHTPICKELCWVSQHRIDNEKLEDQARTCVLRHADEYHKDELKGLIKHLDRDYGIRAKRIGLLVTELLDIDELAFTTMTIDDLAQKMDKYLLLDGKDFAKMVIKTNAEEIYQILDLKYAATPLRAELIKALAKKVMIMDKSAAETELKPRSAMRKNSKRTESIVSEHITRAASKNAGSGQTSAQPNPRKRSSLRNTEMAGIHTPIQRHPAGKGAGKASTRRPVGTPLFPLRRSSYGDEYVGSGSPKRRKLTDSTISNGESRPSFSFASKTDDTTPEPDILYQSDDSDSTSGEYETVLEPVDIRQTEEPNGPDGLWTCERERCETVIVKAHEEEGRDKVRKHFLWHADEVEARYNLVKAAERPYLPVENLLRHFERVGQRVRGKEEKNAERDGNGVRIGKPLQRAGL